MKIRLPKTYSQNDPQWKNKTLGSQGTIGQYGCLIACAAMMCAYFGHDETPISLNDFLQNNGGYINGNLYVWKTIEKKYTDIVYQGLIQTPDTLTQAQMDAIRNIINQGYPVFLKIDILPTTSKLDQHWILAVDYDGDDLIIQDPWDGAQKKITTWGVQPQKLIYAFAYYVGTPMIAEPSLDDSKEEKIDANLIEIETLKLEKEAQTKKTLQLQFEHNNLQAEYQHLYNEYLKLKEQFNSNLIGINQPMSSSLEKENKYEELKNSIEILKNKFENKNPDDTITNNSSDKLIWQSKKAIISVGSNLLSFGLIIFQTAQVKPSDDWQTASVKLLGAALTAFGISNVASQYVKSQGLVDTTALTDEINK